MTTTSDQKPSRPRSKVQRDKSLRETGQLPAKPKRGHADIDTVITRYEKKIGHLDNEYKRLKKMQDRYTKAVALGHTPDDAGNRARNASLGRQTIKNVAPDIKANRDERKVAARMLGTLKKKDKQAQKALDRINEERFGDVSKHPGHPNQRDHGRYKGGRIKNYALRHGGITHDPRAQSHVTSGFAIAPYPKTERGFSVDAVKPQDINNWLDEVGDLLKNENHHVGGWVENGTLWLDVSVVLDDEQEARQAGIAAQQQAIFNLGTFEEITLGERSGRDLDVRKNMSKKRIFSNNLSRDELVTAILAMTNKVEKMERPQRPDIISKHPGHPDQSVHGSKHPERFNNEALIDTRRQGKQHAKTDKPRVLSTPEHREKKLRDNIRRNFTPESRADGREMSAYNLRETISETSDPKLKAKLEAKLAENKKRNKKLDAESGQPSRMRFHDIDDVKPVKKHGGHADQSVHGGGKGGNPRYATLNKPKPKAQPYTKSVREIGSVEGSKNDPRAPKKPRRKFKMSLGASAVDSYSKSKAKHGVSKGVDVEIAKVDEDKRLVFGWMYKATDETGTPIVDRQGDFMLPEDVEKMAYDYVKDARKGGVMHLRSDVGVGKSYPVHVSDLVESVVFDKDKVREMGLPEGSIPDGAWWVGYRVNNDAVWKGVKDGKYRAFSIHGTGKRIPVEKSDQPQGGTTQQPSSTPQTNVQQPTAPTAGQPQQQGQRPRMPGRLKRKVTVKFRPVKPAKLDAQMATLAGKK